MGVFARVYTILPIFGPSTFPALSRFCGIYYCGDSYTAQAERFWAMLFHRCLEGGGANNQQITRSPSSVSSLGRPLGPTLLRCALAATLGAHALVRL